MIAPPMHIENGTKKIAHPNQNINDLDFTSGPVPSKSYPFNSWILILVLRLMIAMG